MQVCLKTKQLKRTNSKKIIIEGLKFLVPKPNVDVNTSKSEE